MTKIIRRNVGMNAFRRGTFENLIYRIERGEFIEAYELSSVLRCQAGKVIPEELLEHICLRLEGRARKPRGRKPGGSPQYFRNLWATVLYRRYLDWLRNRERKHELSSKT